ncbi:superoxide dismutase family protein [Guptibacillus hwajinpoensis]|uniref:superoxide dismutase family protein n=1 Tax=Guptibacillus hwajinpoensis TaxID=208199 RepID=UPI0024B3BCA8|nr:superoxide dismutase family protein [Pseudalkalibacillus hwajinpoensis]
MKRWAILLLMMSVLLVLAACGGGNEEGTTEDEPETTTENAGESEQEEMDTITVTMKNQDDEEIGTAELMEHDGATMISLDVSDLPAGEHGFHIHETGSCEAPDFKSAGGHYNPGDMDHGMESDNGPHAGDMENIEVSEDGTLQTDIMNDKVTLKTGEENSLLKEGGTAIVIHAGADDMESQPSGDAGDRIACGVIGE